METIIFRWKKMKQSGIIGLFQWKQSCFDGNKRNKVVSMESMEFRDSMAVSFPWARKRKRFGCFDGNRRKFWSLFMCLLLYLIYCWRVVFSIYDSERSNPFSVHWFLQTNIAFALGSWYLLLCNLFRFLCIAWYVC